MMERKEEITPGRDHLVGLDGLRGLAILLVATGHLFYRFYPFKFGWIGLNLFFVLSGYLITDRLFYHITLPTAKYFKNFYARRVLRIFPLYYGCLAFFFGLLPFFYVKYNQNFGSLFHIQAWYWLYCSNWRQVFYGLPPNQLFFHFWSLAVEEQFYLAWPLLFFIFRSLKQRLLIICLLIFLAVVIRFWSYGTISAYYNTFTAGEPLLLGCLVCIMQKNDKLLLVYRYIRLLFIFSLLSLGLILISNSDLHITNKLLLLIGYSNINVIWVFLLCVLITPNSLNTFVTRIFSTKILIWLGLYSYGIYVFHWIILQLFINKYERWGVDHGWGLSGSFWISRLLGICCILMISYASYHLYERKFLLLKKYF